MSVSLSVWTGADLSVSLWDGHSLRPQHQQQRQRRVSNRLQGNHNLSSSSVPASAVQGLQFWSLLHRQKQVKHEWLLSFTHFHVCSKTWLIFAHHDSWTTVYILTRPLSDPFISGPLGPMGGCLPPLSKKRDFNMGLILYYYICGCVCGHRVFTAVRKYPQQSRPATANHSWLRFIDY